MIIEYLYVHFDKPVDISKFVGQCFGLLYNFLELCCDMQAEIIIFNGTDFGLQNFTVSLLDFNIGLVVISIVIGAFLKINRADNFYSNHKD